MGRKLITIATVLAAAGWAVNTWQPQWLASVPGWRHLQQNASDWWQRAASKLELPVGLPGKDTWAQITGQARDGGRSLAGVHGRARVIDGDSLQVNGVEVRLHGIDAPELRQTCRDASGRRYPCGRMARQHLRQLVRGRTIRCRRITTDRYRRMIARCTLPDGTDIGQRMVRDGWAVAFVRYSRAYVGDERLARQARKGLWQGRFVPPAVWRRMQRP